MITLTNSDLITIRYISWVLGGLPQRSVGVAPARNLLDRIIEEITSSIAAGPATEESAGLFVEREDSTVITLEFSADKRRAAQTAALRLAKDVLSVSTSNIGKALEELDTAITRIKHGKPLMPTAPRAPTITDQNINNLDDQIADQNIDNQLRQYLEQSGTEGINKTKTKAKAQTQTKNQR